MAVNAICRKDFFATPLRLPCDPVDPVDGNPNRNQSIRQLGQCSGQLIRWDPFAINPMVPPLPPAQRDPSVSIGSIHLS